VSKDGRLLTNFHVIDSCRQLTVQSGRLSGAARVVAADAANDLALLATNLKPVRIADWRYSVRDDEPVVVYGFAPTGERAADGNALGLTGWRHNKLLFTEAGVEPGMSGSAIMDGSGLVIGINVGDIGHVMGMGTGSSAAAALLDARRIPHPEAREAAPLSKSEIVERSKAISVKVTCQLDGRLTDGRVCLKSGGAFLPDDKIIDACNREIPSGRFSGEALRMLYVQRAASHLNKHHIDLALRDCDEAAKIAEDSDNFHCSARIYLAMGAYGRAITEWDEAVRIFPKDVIALSGRGGSFLARNDLAHAMADLDKAIEIAIRSSRTPFGCEGRFTIKCAGMSAQSPISIAPSRSMTNCSRNTLCRSSAPTCLQSGPTLTMPKVTATGPLQTTIRPSHSSPTGSA
jgi:hypothetical protein